MPNNSTKFIKRIIEDGKYSRTLEFRNLMKFRISNILVVSSDYDYYIFEEDGRLYDLLRTEYKDLNLSHAPDFTHIPSGEQALNILKNPNRYDLILVTLHIEDMKTVEFARKVKLIGTKTPIILLGYDNKEIHELYNNIDIALFDKVFVWQGDYRIIIGIIKYLEDKYNVAHDSYEIGVQSIILIEDNVKFYSSYLPIIYTELLKQSRYLIADGVNLSQKFLRMRARPKILLCSTYEEAEFYFNRYQEYILGVISDVDFSNKGVKDPIAGIKFCKYVKSRQEDVPVLLQSKNEENKIQAEEIGASFLLKNSPNLLEQLRQFMINYFSFGDFIFRDKDGNEVARAKNLDDLEDVLNKLNDESIEYHASRNHFSNWLKARTEFWLAHQLRPKKVSDFNSIDDLRQILIKIIRDFRTSRHKRLIIDFNQKYFEKYSCLSRIGGGSLGGKARGLGFVNNLLLNYGMTHKYENVEIKVPSAIILGTEIFEEFISSNDLFDFALYCKDDKKLFDRFCAAQKFPYSAIKELGEFLRIVDEPLAVRSSSLLEDSQGYPFAGVYDSYMIPNSHPQIRTRLYQLISVIKRVFASIYLQKSKQYIAATNYRLEEEKMAVIIQKMVGSRHGNKFYPEFSGVAKSYNFYPSKPLEPNDGIVSIAMGQGKMITEGGAGVRFCPKYPNHFQKNLTTKNLLEHGQKDFFALEMHEYDEKTEFTEDLLLKKYYLEEAEKDGTLGSICSTYSHENDVIYDGISRSGTRIFSLAPLLKYNLFPLADIIKDLLAIGSKGMGVPVEIEFAVNLSVPPGEKKEFSFLQMRPLVVESEIEELDFNDYNLENILCSSEKVMGNGLIRGLRDIVFVDYEKFERSKTQDIAAEIATLNAKLARKNREYLLIGIGRLGTLDPWLGIPLRWEQITGARAIIETNLKDMDVEPSQGSHFFQNLTSFKVGYFTISQPDKLDWRWLNSHEFEEEMNYTKLVHLDEPIVVKINGKENKGIVLKRED